MTLSEYVTVVGDKLGQAETKGDSQELIRLARLLGETLAETIAQLEPQKESAMPMYLGKAVSDDDLQALISAYKDGQLALGHKPPGSDQPVIDRLEACGITNETGADVVGRYDVIPSDVTEPDKQGRHA